MRSRAAKEISESEKNRKASQMQAVQAWLDTNMVSLYDELDRIAGHCHPGSTQWVMQDPKMKIWMQNTTNQPILWLKGKPGAGKSVICSKAVQELQKDQHCTTLFYLCNHFNSRSNEAANILRSLVSQMIQSKHGHDLVLHILDECISPGYLASASQLRKVIPTLLKGFSSMRFVIDGLDEIEVQDQREVLSDLLEFVPNSLNAGSVCKILVSSRDIPSISKFLAQKAVLSMSDELQAFKGAVRPFVRSQLDDLRKSLADIEVGDDVLEIIQNRLVEKSNGKVLFC